MRLSDCVQLLLTVTLLKEERQAKPISLRGQPSPTQPTFSVSSIFIISGVMEIGRLSFTSSHGKHNYFYVLIFTV